MSWSVKPPGRRVVRLTELRDAVAEEHFRHHVVGHALLAQFPQHRKVERAVAILEPAPDHALAVPDARRGAAQVLLGEAEAVLAAVER